MRAEISFVSGQQDRAGWVRVGHNADFTNPDAVWKLRLVSEGETVSKVDGAALHFQWNNDAAGTGWQGAFRYVITIRLGSASGEMIKQHANDLSGKSGNWNVDRTDWGFLPDTDYYLCLNVKEQTPISYSSMKSFSTTASVDNLRSKCAPPTGIVIGDGSFRTYRAPGAGATMQILGGGGGINNAFSKWYIEELIFSDSEGTLVDWHPAKNGEEQEDASICYATSRTVTIYPTKTRGENKRYRIRAKGAAGDAFDSEMVEFSPNICTNRLPATCTDLLLDKLRIPPAQGLRLSFAGGGDVDGNLQFYQIRATDENGEIYSGGDLGRQYDTAKKYVDIELAEHADAFCAGTKWKFQVRGHDGLEAGAWSECTPFVEIGGVVRIYNSNGELREAVPYIYDGTGLWKEAVPYCFNENGTPRIGI